MVFNSELFMRQLENYSTDRAFKARIRNMVFQIESMEVSPATKMFLLKKVEETCSRHSNNQQGLGKIMKTLKDNNEKLLDSINMMNNAVKQEKRNIQMQKPQIISNATSFDINLD